MNPAFFWLLISLVCSLLISNKFGTPAAAAAAHGGNETDRLALLAFKAKITDDPFGVLSSWNESNIHLCSQWYGVKCGRRHQRVTVLDIGSQKLGGSISPCIGNLSFLRRLILENNSFTDGIPPELGHNLPRLKFLWLNNNSLGGEIPRNLSACSTLISLDVSRNKLVGKIPVELFGCLSPKTEEIFMQNNNLTGGIPISFGNLSSLFVLSLSENNLDGSIPTTIGQLAQLKNLVLSVNTLSGTIPFSVFNLSQMTIFDVLNNKIRGTLPTYLGDKLPNLEFFSIAENQFTGSVPASLSNTTKLGYLDISVNKLTGKVPASENWHKLTELNLAANKFGGDGGANDLGFICSLTNATDLQYLEILQNNFGGMLPECFSNLSRKLSGLYFSENQIYGSIPVGIQNFVNLADFGFSNNRLEGSLPTEMGRLQKLQWLSLSDNQFSGTIPSSLGNLSLLSNLLIDGNHFNGNIPPSLGNCQNLVSLTLSHNHLSGIIPPEIFLLPSLSMGLDISRNYLIGSLPMEVGQAKNLEYLNASDNMLSGEIPSTLGSCVGLEYLDIQGNSFQGSIPTSWSSLRGIRIMDLSRNNISGKIPNFLGTFALEYLNLSFNAFEGKLPNEGVFRNASAVFVNGNLKLCGGIPELKLPNCSFKGSKKKVQTVNYKLVVPIVIGVLGLISLVLCLLTFCWLKKKRRQRPSESREHSLFIVSYQTLNKATKGFSSANLIGMGAFGTVYKGILDDGRHVAVKVLKLEHHGAAKSFIAECDAMRNIRHRNLVKVVTTCSSIDYQGNDFKAVVYEFMVNGSLEEWLHPVRREEEARDEVRHLNLIERFSIAIDVAAALDYLHNDCQTPIVHCDIKPSNILLDEELTGHVGDFGLAKWILERTDSSYANQASSIGVRGSIGYTPPEYGIGSEMSANGDVYSFGILLLEMMTGKRPTDDMFHADLNLHDFAQMALPLPDQVIDIVDKSLLNNNKDQVVECLISAIKIGVSCSLPSPQDRKNIHDVVRELHLLGGIL